MNSLFSLSERLGNSFFTLTWQTGLLILVVAIATLCLRKARPAVRYALWLVVLIRLCVPVGISTPLGIPPKVVQQATPKNVYMPPEPAPEWIAEPQFANAEMPAPAGESERAFEAIPAPQLPKPAAPPPKPPLPPLSMKGWIGLGWMIVALVLAASMCLRMWLVRRIIRKSEPVTNPKLNELLDELRARLGIRRAVALRMLPATAKTLGPCATGVFRPVIFIPARMVEHWDAISLEPILLHELAHIRRGDLIVHAMQVLVQIVYWFHPLVWFSNARLRHERELICDDIAVAHSGGNSKRYGATVLRAVEEFQRSSSPIAGLGIGESKLATRLKRLLGKSYTVPRPLGIMALIAVLLGGVLGVMIASEGKPPKKQGNTADSAVSKKIEGRIWIQITDPEGKPLVGATVSPEGYGMIRLETGKDSPGSSVITDDLGMAEIAFPPMLPWQVEEGILQFTVDYPKYAPARLSHPLKEQQGIYKLENGNSLTVAGYLNDPQLVLTGLYVNCSGLLPNTWRETPEGILETKRLPKEVKCIQLVKFGPDGPTHFSKATQLPADLSKPQERLNLQLTPAMRFEGKLDERIPRPIQNGWIGLRIYSRDISGDQSYERLIWQTGMRVGPDGSFSFPALPAGDLVVGAGCDGFASANSYSVEKGLVSAEVFKTKYPAVLPDLTKADEPYSGINSLPQNLALSFALIADAKAFSLPMVPTGSVKIRVEGPDGRPVQGADVIDNSDARTIESWAFDNATYLLDGKVIPEKYQAFSFSFPQTDANGFREIKNLPPGHRRLYIQHPEFAHYPHKTGTRPISIESGEVSETTVQLEEAPPTPAEVRRTAVPRDPKAFGLRAVVEEKSATTKEYVYQMKGGESENLHMESEVLMDGTSVEAAFVGYGQDGYEVILQFTEQAAKRFGEITKQNTGKRLGIFVFDELFSSPNIKEPIFGGRATISKSGMTEAEAKALADKFNQPAKKPDASKKSPPVSKSEPTAETPAISREPKAFEIRAVAEKKSQTTKEYPLKTKGGKEWERAQLESEVLLDGASVAAASVAEGQGGVLVVVQFTEKGAKRFEEITRQNVDKCIGLLVFDELLVAPLIKEVSYEGKIKFMAPSLTAEEAKALADKINQPEKPPTAAELQNEKEVQRIKVTDDVGNPLKGVSITAGHFGILTERGSASRDLKDYNFPTEFTTDERGEFELSYPKYFQGKPVQLTQRVWLVATHPQFVRKEIAYPVSESADKLVLTKGRTLEVSGYLNDSKVLVSGLKVQVFTPTPKEAIPVDSWIQDESGVVRSNRFPAGKVWIRAVHFPASGPAHFSDVQVVDFTSNSSQSLSLRLKPGIQVQGRISNDVKRPVVNGWVNVLIVAPEIQWAPGPDTNHDHMRWLATVPIQQDGSFVFASLPPGEAGLIAGCDGYVSTDAGGQRAENFARSQRTAQGAHPLMLQSEPVTMEVPMEQTGEVVIKCVDEANKPIPEVRVSTSPGAVYLNAKWGIPFRPFAPKQGSEICDTTNWPTLPKFGITGADGTVRLTNVLPSKQSYQVQHLAYEENSPVVEVSAGKTTEITVQLKSQDQARRSGTPIKPAQKPEANESTPKPKPTADAAISELPHEIVSYYEDFNQLTLLELGHSKNSLNEQPLTLDSVPSHVERAAVLRDNLSKSTPQETTPQPKHELVFIRVKSFSQRDQEISVGCDIYEPTPSTTGPLPGHTFHGIDFESLKRLRHESQKWRKISGRWINTVSFTTLGSVEGDSASTTPDASQKSPPEPKPTADAGSSAGKPKTFLKVVDQSGNPIAGATVLRWYPKATSTSNSEGLADATPLIENLGDANPKQIGLNVDAPGYCMEQVHVELGKPWDPVVLKEAAVLEVSGYLDDPTKILKNVFVQIATTSWLQEPKPLTWTEPQPGVKRHDRVPLEAVWVRAFHIKDDGDLLFSKTTRVDMRSVVPPKLNLQLYPGIKLQGRFDENVSRPVQGGWVCMEICSEEVIRPNYGGFGRLNWRAEIQVNPDGTFTTPSLPPGEIGVVAGSKGFVYQGAMQGKSRAILVMKPDQNRLVIPMERAASIEVKVVDLKGQPVADADVHSSPYVYWKDSAHGAAGICGFSSSVYLSTGKGAPLPLKREIDCSAKTNAEGVALVGCFQRDKTSGWVTHPDFEMSEFETSISADKVASVTVQMAPKGVITMREVVNYLKEDELVNETKDSLWNLLTK